MSGRGDLAGRTALVTGAARRLGRAIALGLAGAGSNVVLHYRTSRQEALDLADELRDGGTKAWTVGGDLADPAAAPAVFERACAEAGPIDILVNNASIFPADELASLTAEAVGANVQVNAFAPLQLARALHAQGRAGNIVNLLDSRIVQRDGAHVAYHLSKRMLFTLTRLMALEFAPRVRVNAVAPGLILPPPGRDEPFLAEAAAGNPLRRWGAPAQVADAVLFLLRADFVTGQVIYVDGGQHMKGALYG